MLHALKLTAEESSQLHSTTVQPSYSTKHCASDGTATERGADRRDDSRDEVISRLVNTQSELLPYVELRVIHSRIP